MEREYKIEAWINGRWELVMRRAMTRSAAEGMLNQFAAQYRVRLVNQNGTLITHRGSVKGGAQ
jgi:hypothetical protein